MTPQEQFVKIKGDYTAKRITHDEALAALIAIGEHPEDARETLYILDGGKAHSDDEKSEEFESEEDLMRSLLARGFDPVEAREMFAAWGLEWPEDKPGQTTPAEEEK